MSSFTEEGIKSSTINNLSKDGNDILTPRQIEIIRQFADGSTNQEVADKMGIAQRTVTVHKYNAFKRIGARNIIEALNYINKYHKKG